MRVILGAPCAGKGSQSTLLSKKYNLHHVCAGTLLRQKYTEGTPERAILNKGGLVCLSKINALIEEKLIEHNFNVILDGYPRTVGQAEFVNYMLKKHNQKISEIIVLECPKEELIRRTSFRTICSNCEITYTSHQICCNVPTVIRVDDTLEVLYNRYEIFMESFYKIQPILQGPFYFVNGRQLPDQIFASISNIIDNNMKK